MWPTQWSLPREGWPTYILQKGPKQQVQRKLSRQNVTEFILLYNSRLESHSRKPQIQPASPCGGWQYMRDLPAEHCPWSDNSYIVEETNKSMIVQEKSCYFCYLGSPSSGKSTLGLPYSEDFAWWKVPSLSWFRDACRSQSKLPTYFPLWVWNLPKIKKKKTNTYRLINFIGGILKKEPISSGYDSPLPMNLVAFLFFS